MGLEDVAFHHLRGELYRYRLTDMNELETVPGGFLGKGVAWLLNYAGIRTNDQLLCEMIPRLFTDLPENKRITFRATLQDFSKTVSKEEIKNLYLNILATIPPSKIQEEKVLHRDAGAPSKPETPENKDVFFDAPDEVEDVFFDAPDELTGIAPPKTETPAKEANPHVQLLEKQILDTFGGDQKATKRIVSLLSPGLQSATFDAKQQTLTLLYNEKAEGQLPDTSETNWKSLGGAAFTRGNKLVLHLDPETQSITKQGGVFEGTRLKGTRLEVTFEIEKMSRLPDGSFRIDPKGKGWLAGMALRALTDRTMTLEDFDKIFGPLIDKWKT